MSSKKHNKPKSSVFFDMDVKEERVITSSSSSDNETESVEVRKDKVEVDDRERLKDIQERDEFSERLKLRDEDNTKRKLDKQSNKILEEAAKRLKLEKEDRTKVMPSLREKSRQEYLERREKDKLVELEQEVMDEEYLWQGVELTEYERKRLEQKKKTLEIAKQYKEADNLEKVDRYYIPDEKNQRKHTDKYAEDIKEKGQNFEARKWEEEQATAALMQFGSRDAKERHAKQEKNYEYLLDDEIDFVQSLRIPGKNEIKSGDYKADLEEDNRNKAKKSMEETRKSLPIYAYRNSLLEAIKEHQVIIIEG
jgi:pre-mRNA-splicing factor ATP-dependent RNA helicase DHX16